MFTRDRQACWWIVLCSETSYKAGGNPDGRCYFFLLFSSRFSFDQYVHKHVSLLGVSGLSLLDHNRII